MPDFTYTRDIPFASDTPAEDQPDMQNNTNSIDSLIAVDHISFGTSDGTGGYHKQSQYHATVAKPTGLIAGNGTVYSKTAGGASEIFFSPDASGNEYQLTKSISASYALFATYTTYSGVLFHGGWTFLPGGLLFQYGLVDAVGAGTDIPFPVTFSAVPYNIQVCAARTNSGSIITVFQAGASYPAASKFQVTVFNAVTGAAEISPVYWTAIGPK